MQNRILALTVVVFGIVFFSINSSSNTTFFITEAEAPKIAVKDTFNDSIINMELESYIIGVVASEMPASFNEEALKAQAVASRTYALYKMSSNNGNYDIVTDVSNQGYIDIAKMHNKWKEDFDKYYSKIKNAVLSTKGEIMLYNGKIVEAYYFAMSNGYTENAELVFNESREYLQSVESSYDSTLKNFQVQKTFEKKEICSILNINCNNLSFSDIKRSTTGRVNSINISGTVYKGTTIRKKLGLRSTDFDVNVIDDKVIFTTKGYGHGVGMSQNGANGMAKAGYNYKEILEYYYKNVKISTI